MSGKERFRLVTPDGLISHDTFVLVDQQPPAFRDECLLLAHSASGRRIAVHRSRVVGARDPEVRALEHRQRSVCLECGKVEGIVEDRVTCPHHDDAECGLLEAKV